MEREPLKWRMKMLHCGSRSVPSHTHVLYVDAIAVIVRAVLERPDPLSNSLKGEPAIFYLAVGLGFDANARALFAYHRRVTALVELAERELAEHRRVLQLRFVWP
jgi:hypothetical protein